jgi:ABC-type multidrug transport system ATPase subunit
VLDEPAAGLDPKARIGLKELLREPQAAGKTIFITSHILSDLEETCSSIAIIEEGRLLRSALLKALGGEAGQLIVFGGIADFDGVAANFAIFDVDLTGNGKIQDHGDLFAAVRAHEAVFHREVEYDTKRDPSLTMFARDEHPDRKLTSF